MKNAAHFFVLPFTFIIFITMLCSTACAPKAEVSLPSTPEPTVFVTLAPMAPPTPPPSPVPTPASVYSEARMAELNQQFQDFLNKEGEFTPEKTQEMMMPTISPLGYDKVGLGIADEHVVQGYFFDYFEKDNRLILLMGFDGKDGNRFISPVEIPLYIYEVIEIEGLTFPVFKHKDNYIQGSVLEEDSDYGERAKLIPLLDAIEGRVIGLGLSTVSRTDFIRYGIS